LRDVKKQFKRNKKLFDTDDENIPVFGTIAAQFNDPGTNVLYKNLMDIIHRKTGAPLISKFAPGNEMSEKIYIIPPHRTRYLSEIADTIRSYNKKAEEQSAIAEKMYALKQSIEEIEKDENLDLKEKEVVLNGLNKRYKELENNLEISNKNLLDTWEYRKKKFTDDYYEFKVRDTIKKVRTYHESLSHTRIPKVAVPKFKNWGEILRWNLQENFPGQFPYTAGIYPFKREEEDPTRMFAGEGCPERTNKRFHYLSYQMPAKRLSTAFDSVTLYGRDPDYRPDIYGKIGNSGVSVCCLDDAKKLYSGFNLADPKTSVSMTINGPAPTITAFFMNAAIDQQCEIYIRQNGLEEEVKNKIRQIYEEKGLQPPQYNAPLPQGNDGLGLLLLGITGDKVLPREIYENIKKDTLSKVRGTV
ncbi:MAG: methylmalonyl-CoA mutase, partial [Bacteroidetes bacterium]